METTATEAGAACLVRVDDAGPVRVVRLDDAARRNALGVPMRVQLIDAVERVLADPGCRVVVLTGSGPSFCAGGDLSGPPPSGAGEARRRLALLADLTRLLVCGEKPIIGAVEGAAAGAGLSIVAACDHVVAASDARFVCAFAKVGLAADAGLSWTLPARIGLGRAKEMLLFGEVVDAETAARYGLVERIVAPGTALTVAMDRARVLAQGAPLSFAATKRTLAATPAGLDELLALEQAAQVGLMGSADFVEGKDAFFARRAAQFRGA
jgi:enoyl-CoA hydratase/carnithine racemase